MSSLAQQLQSLKLKQKDEVKIQERSKASFIFDAKTAANIDDDTLFLICQR